MYAIIRIRGKVTVQYKIERALQMLRLNAVNNCVVVPETESYRGMIQKVKDYVTFGKIDVATLKAMLEKRGRLTGGRRLDGKNVKELGYDSIDALAAAIFEGKVKMKDLKALKKVFRLSPPSRGLKSIKTPYPKGDLGNRKEKINELIMRMI